MLQVTVVFEAEKQLPTGLPVVRRSPSRRPSALVLVSSAQAMKTCAT
jgi:hypothetical protein